MASPQQLKIYKQSSKLRRNFALYRTFFAEQAICSKGRLQHPSKQKPPSQPSEPTPRICCQNASMASCKLSPNAKTINNLPLQQLCVKSGCYHSEETCSCKQAIRGPGLQELAVAENYFLACFWPLPHANKEASDIICRLTTHQEQNAFDWAPMTGCRIPLMLDTARRTPYAYVGHSPSDSVCLCWTQSVGLRMLMLDTIRRTPCAYVGHNPSDSGVARATPDPTVWQPLRGASRPLGGADHTLGGPALHLQRLTPKIFKICMVRMGVGAS